MSNPDLMKTPLTDQIHKRWLASEGPLERPMLVADYDDGFDMESRAVVIERIDAALSLFIRTKKVALWFVYDEAGVYVALTDCLGKILDGHEELPRGDMSAPKDLKWRHGHLDETSKRVVKEALVRALAPIVTTADALHALKHQDWFIFIEAASSILQRLPAVAKEVRCD